MLIKKGKYRTGSNNTCNNWGCHRLLYGIVERYCRTLHPYRDARSKCCGFGKLYWGSDCIRHCVLDNMRCYYGCSDPGDPHRGRVSAHPLWKICPGESVGQTYGDSDHYWYCRNTFPCGTYQGIDTDKFGRDTSSNTSSLFLNTSTDTASKECILRIFINR